MNKKRQEHFMREALIEGRKAIPRCKPNPPVGCVLVKKGEIIAKGHTNEPGQPHAEAMALNQLGRHEEGITAFVTLEPCSFYGRTPSCAKTLVEAGVTSVYVGMIDPDPRNSGAGIEMLRNAGVHVQVGILAEEVRGELGGYLDA